MPIYRTVDMPHGNHWGLHIYEIVIPEGEVRDMTAQEIGEQVLLLMAQMPQSREDDLLDMYLEEAGNA